VAHESAINGFFTPSDHCVYPQEFFSRAWAFGYSMPGRDDAMPCSLGLPHFALAIAGALAPPRRWVFGVVLSLYLALLLFMTPPWGFLWDRVLWLRYVQFPWRILSLTATLQVICACGLGPVLAKLGRARYLLVGLACVGIVGWQLDQFSANRERLNETVGRLESHRRTMRFEFRTYTATGEFTPKTAVTLPTIGPRQSRPLLEGGTQLDSSLVLEGDELRFRCVVPRGTVRQLVINQACFPGWRLRLDGRILPYPEIEKQRLADGRMALLLTDGEAHEVTGGYEGPPGAAGRITVMGFFALLIVLLVAVDRRAGYR
jgi:hypothetical protein